MTVVGVSMVRDEEDIVEHTVRHMLEQVDAVVVADNLSTDRTREILHGLEAELGRLYIVDDPDPAYLQSEKMSHLAQIAHDLYEAEWVVPFDADEWWYSPHDARLADTLEAIEARWHVVPAELYDHVCTAFDPPEENPIVRIGWRRRDPAPLPKVAVRWRHDLVIEQGNHGAHYREFTPKPFDPRLVVRHFPYRSVAQLVRKVRNGAAAYRAAGSEQPEHNGAHWRQWGDLLDREGPDAIAEIFRKWYWRAVPRDFLVIEGEKQRPLMFDPAP